MANGAGRAALIGALVAVVAVVLGAVGVLVWAGGGSDEPVERYLLVVTAPGADGSEVAALAAAIGPDGRVEILDVLAPADVPGTSAASAQEAYPFGGGDSVARALAEQTGGEPLPWVTLSAETAGELIDDAGGIEVEVPAGLSAYTDGSLALFEPGIQRLDGAQAIALAAGAAFLEDPASRLGVQQDVGGDMAALLAEAPEQVREHVVSGRARSSLSAEQLPQR